MLSAMDEVDGALRNILVRLEALEIIVIELAMADRVAVRNILAEPIAMHLRQVPALGRDPADVKALKDHLENFLDLLNSPQVIKSDA